VFDSCSTDEERAAHVSFLKDHASFVIRQQPKPTQKEQPTMRNNSITALCTASLLVLGHAAAFAATGEVTLSGSTWTGKVDGVTKYTGTSMAGAASACASAMTSGGTINIRNSGTVNGSIRIYSNTKVDGKSCTLTGNGTGGIVRAYNVSTVGAQNINMAGSDWFGMYFSTCNGQSFSGVNGGSGISYRIDNCKGGWGYSLACGSPTLSSGSDNGVETYGINGVTWSTITASDRGHCGLLLNYSKNASGSTVKGTRCGWGTGYAGFRTANNNTGPSTLTYDNATSCGRGFYSTTGSYNTTVTRVNATSCSGIGIWLGVISQNVKVNGGTITGCSSCWTDSNPSGSGNSVTVTCR
jgi:hypothetical protein